MLSSRSMLEPDPDGVSQQVAVIMTGKVSSQFLHLFLYLFYVFALVFVIHGILNSLYYWNFETYHWHVIVPLG